MRKFKKLLGIVTILMIVLTTLPVSVFAAGSYTAYASKSTLTVGSSTNLIIKTAKGEGQKLNPEGQFTIESSNPSVATVSVTSTWVNGATMDDKIVIKGVSEGTATITVTPKDVSDDQYNLLTGSKSIKITVKKATTTNTNTNTNANKDKETTTVVTKSSDATLKELSSKVVKIPFKSSTTKYTVNVDKTVTSLGLKAVANHAKATVEITGDENFVTGENIVKVIVTAEDGTTKTYQITVIKSKFGTGPLLDLKVVGYGLSQEFDPSVYNYNVDVIGKTSVEIDYTLADASSKVVIEGADNLKVGENLVKVIVTEKDGTVTTYTITVNVAKEGSNIVWILLIVILAVLVVSEAAYIIIKTKKEKQGKK